MGRFLVLGACGLRAGSDGASTERAGGHGRYGGARDPHHDLSGLRAGRCARRPTRSWRCRSRASRSRRSSRSSTMGPALDAKARRALRSHLPSGGSWFVLVAVALPLDRRRLTRVRGAHVTLDTRSAPGCWCSGVWTLFPALALGSPARCCATSVRAPSGSSTAGERWLLALVAAGYQWATADAEGRGRGPPRGELRRRGRACCCRSCWR